MWLLGGGYTGIEVAVEINTFVREAAKSYSQVDPKEIKVILLQGGGRILPELTGDLAIQPPAQPEPQRTEGLTASAVRTDGASYSSTYLFFVSRIAYSYFSLSWPEPLP